MAVASSSASKQKLPDQKGKINSNSGKKKEEKSRKQSDSGGSSRAKRTKCPGDRLLGGRICNSENGKYCHQCRQKTMYFAAACKNQKDKPCTIKFCHKCLLNRYGEKAEEMAVLEDWNCPKCRGICNCSFCMKKQGHQPTGILVHRARATGFSSVSELLDVKGPEHFGVGKIVKGMDIGPTKAAASHNEPAVALPRQLGKENSINGNSDSNLPPLPLPSNLDDKKYKKMKQNGLKEMQDSKHHVGVLFKETSPIKPRISNKRLKQTQDGNQDDGVLLKETSPRKPRITKEGLGEGNQFDGIVLKKTSTKKPKNSRIANGVSKKEFKTSRTVGVLEEDKKLETRVSKGVLSKRITCKKSKEQRDSRPHKGRKVLDGQKLDKDGTQSRIVVESRKKQTNAMEFQTKDIDVDIPLPQGTELTTVAGIDLPPECVGHALQFLEFCAAFEEILDLKEGEPEYILQELIRGGRGCQGRYSPVVQFHIQLLSLIQKDLGENSPVIAPKNRKNSWLHALQNCASRSQCVLKKLKLERFGREADDYDSLESSEKLRLLNFLCDEFLCTAKIRSWIDDQNSKLAEKMKEAKERVLAAKHKEKQLKLKMQDEVATAIIAKNGAFLSISEHEAIVSQIKTEAAQAHAEMVESKGMLPKEKQRSDAVRTEPILLDVNGRTYWRLKGCSDESNVLLQDVGTWDAVGSVEKWFTYDVEQEKEIGKYIYSSRKRRLRSQKIADRLSSKSSKAGLTL